MQWPAPDFDPFFLLSAYEDIGKKPRPNANHVECSFDNMPGEDQFCQVKTSELITGPCTEENHFGFDQGKPCILIKLNKVSSVPNTLHKYLGYLALELQWLLSTLISLLIDWLIVVNAKLSFAFQFQVEDRAIDLATRIVKCAKNRLRSEMSHEKEK